MSDKTNKGSIINSIIDKIKDSDLDLESKVYVINIILESLNIRGKEREWDGLAEALHKVQTAVHGHTRHVSLRALLVSAIHVYKQSGRDKDQWIEACELCWDAYSK